MVIKKLLLTGIDFSDIKKAAVFLKVNKFFGCYVEISPYHITPEYIALAKLLAINTLVPFDCMETGKDSLDNVVRENPDVVGLLNSLPANKVIVVKEYARGDYEPVAGSIIALGLNFNANDLMVFDSDDMRTNFYSDKEAVAAYSENYPGLEDRVKFYKSKNMYFNVLDVSLHTALNIDYL